jgi:ribosomal protein L15
VSRALNIEVSGASVSAIAAIEAAGGTVKVRIAKSEAPAA